MAVTCTLALIAATFTVEVLAIQNSFLKEEKNVIKAASNLENNKTSTDKIISSEDERLNVVNNYNVVSNTNSKNNLVPYSSTNNLNNIINLNNESNQDNSNLMEKNEKDDNFYIFKRYEISKLANRVFSKPLYFFVVFIMVFYLYISITSGAVISGVSIKRVLEKTFQKEFPDYTYKLIVMLYYILALIISLNNINKLKKLTIIIMTCRIVVILCMIGSMIYLLSKYGAAKPKDIPLFNVKNITIIIGNALFYFMTHHSIPGMVENFTPQKKLMKFIVIGYILGFLFMVGFGILALVTFSQYQNCDQSKYPISILVK